MSTPLFRRIGLLVLAACLLAPSVWAQGNQRQAAPPPPAPKVDVNDNELKTVANVYLKIETLQSEYRPKIQQAKDRKTAMKLQQEFQQKVTKKLKAAEGITPQRFGKIMRAAQADKELRQRLIAAIETARPDSQNNG